jgi:hypothetical protein
LQNILSLLETDDAAAWLHASLNLVRDTAKTAAKEQRELASADATAASLSNGETPAVCQTDAVFAKSKSNAVMSARGDGSGRATGDGSEPTWVVTSRHLGLGHRDPASLRKNQDHHLHRITATRHD